MEDIPQIGSLTYDTTLLHIDISMSIILMLIFIHCVIPNKSIHQIKKLELNIH